MKLIIGAANRLLKAKLDILQKEFDKLLSERNDKVKNKNKQNKTKKN